LKKRMRSRNELSRLECCVEWLIIEMEGSD
jgi:hypothetical protein